MWLKIISDLQFSLTVILSVIIGGGYYFWKYNNGNSIDSEIKKLTSSISQVEQEIQSLRSKQAELQSTSTAFKSVGTEIKELYRYIPHQLKSSQVLKYVNTLTKQSGVHLEDVHNYGSVKKEKLYEKIKISMVIKGFFSEILLFLTSLTKLDIIVTVEKFMIQNSTNANNSTGFVDELRMSMDIYSFRYINPELDLKSSVK